MKGNYYEIQSTQTHLIRNKRKSQKRRLLRWSLQPPRGSRQEKESQCRGLQED